MAEMVSRLGTEPETILRISAVAQIAPVPTSNPTVWPPSQAPRT